MLIEHHIEFGIGELVYLVTDPDQNKRIVTGIMLRPSKTVLYVLSFGTVESYNYEVEITRERNVITATS